MKLLPVALALFAFAALLPSSRADSPISPNSPGFTASIPAELDGLQFEMRLPEGKTRFQQGETIPVRLIFSNQGAKTLYLGTFYDSPLCSFEVTPRDGVTNPLADLPIQTAFFVAGRAPGGRIALSIKPTEKSFILNERVRFDRPGTFQIRATTNAVYADGQPVRRGPLFSGNGPSASSNSVSLEIVPADPQWQQQQVDAWRAYWAKLKPDTFGWRRPDGVQPPANDLRYLNTRAAARAMIDRLGQDEFARSSESEASYLWRSGLIGFSDREWLIGAMKDALKRPDYPVTQGFLDNLSTLQALYHVARAGQETPPGPFAQVVAKANLANWQLTHAVLASKQGRARAMTVHSLLEIAWLSPLQTETVVQRQLPRLVAMVPDIFSDLPGLPQQYLLDDRFNHFEWERVKSPRLIAPLVQAWKTLTYVRGGSKDLGDLILRHLYELAPQVARPLILEEMVAPRPRASLEVLSLLPDKSLPQLQDIWWTGFNTGLNQDTTLHLVKRYGTPSLKSKFQHRYQIDMQ